LFPEGFRPGKYSILDHTLVATPDVIDEDLDSASFTSDKFERSAHFSIHPVVTADTRDVLVIGRVIPRRAASYEHLGAMTSEFTCDPSANTEGPTGHDGNLVL
jgi:hypothetical protein